MNESESNVGSTQEASSLHSLVSPRSDVSAALNRELERGAGAEPVHREVVRLKTNCWRNDKGLHIMRSLTTLKRKSSGHQMLDEEITMTSPDEAARMIVNLNECKDGIYVVVTCNESKDWETGYIDGYDFKLLPFGGGGEGDSCGTAEKGTNDPSSATP